MDIFKGFGLPTKKQWLEIVKATIYVSISAGLDYVLSLSAGTTFGVLTAPINAGLVMVKKLFTAPKK